MESTKLQACLSFTINIPGGKGVLIQYNCSKLNYSFLKQRLFQIAVSFQHCVMYREKMLTTSKSYFCLFYWVQKRLQLVAEHTSTQK